MAVQHRPCERNRRRVGSGLDLPGGRRHLPTRVDGDDAISRHVIRARDAVDEKHRARPNNPSANRIFAPACLRAFSCRRARGVQMIAARYSFTEERNSPTDAKIRSSCCTARVTTYVAIAVTMQTATASPIPTRARAAVSALEFGIDDMCSRRWLVLLPAPMTCSPGGSRQSHEGENGRAFRCAFCAWPIPAQ
jgi:hypothetical protein